MNFSDDLSSLLGDIQLFPEGGTYDPAAWDDWLDALSNKECLSIQEAYEAMIKFLEGYFERTSFSKDIGDLLDSLKIENKNYREMLSKWEEIAMQKIRILENSYRPY